MNTKLLLKYSVYASLLIQVLTGLANMWILQYKTPSSVHIIHELVYVELAVQIVEVVFYIWLTYNLFKISNITPNRYYDWMFTTPTMLITLVAYFIFLKYKASYTDTSSLTLIGIVTKEYYQIITIVILNAVMLLFGYLGEVGKMGKKLSVFMGTIAFLSYFYIIYEKYVVGVEDAYTMFYLFFAIWSLYGVAALLPYDWKNISYNILDLFAKNFFGVFLTIILYRYAVEYR
jgi:hypothetical protein